MQRVSLGCCCSRHVHPEFVHLWSVQVRDGRGAKGPCLSKHDLSNAMVIVMLLLRVQRDCGAA